MSLDVRSGHGRCHLCGRVMVGGRCRVCDGPSHPLSLRERAAVVPRIHLHPGWFVLMLVGTALTVAALFQVGGLREPADPAAPGPGSGPDWPTVGISAPAWPINVPVTEWDMPSAPGGYAFAIRTAADTSTLLTDYHVIAGSYLRGDRMVVLDVGADLVTGMIASVSADPHVAVIDVAGPLPVLERAPEPVREGELVSVLAGRQRQVTSGRVVSYPGPGGATHVVFQAVVPPALAGAPVVNSRGQVVGIAEPSVQYPDAAGLGFAVPISDACAALRC